LLLNYLSLNAKSLLCSPQIFVTVIFQKGIHVRGTIHPGGDAPPVRVRRSCPFTAQVQLPERPAAAGKRISALSRGLQRQPSARNDGRHPESITPPGPSRIFTLELAITARENKSILGKNISRMYRNQLWCFFFSFLSWRFDQEKSVVEGKRSKPYYVNAQILSMALCRFILPSFLCLLSFSRWQLSAFYRSDASA
jgi:hypothetical protein